MYIQKAKAMTGIALYRILLVGVAVFLTACSASKVEPPQSSVMTGIQGALDNAVSSLEQAPDGPSQEEINAILPSVFLTDEVMEPVEERFNIVANRESAQTFFANLVAGTWSNGILALSGNLVFQRQASAAPDGPFPDMQIAFKPVDNDGVTIDPARVDVLTALGVLNVDLDVFPTEPGTAAYALIAEHAFRYGRLIVNNAYGPETEDLALTFLVEYFDGTQFVRNTLDNCSVVDVADISFVGGSYTGDLDPGETVLTSPDTVTFLNGQTQGLQNVVSPTDSPLETSAPGEGNSGTVNITLNLSAAGLSYLGFEWDDQDNDYNEDPSAQLEFGQYRQHDRIINWQEIYNRATP